MANSVKATYVLTVYTCALYVPHSSVHGTCFVCGDGPICVNLYIFVLACKTSGFSIAKQCNVNFTIMLPLLN